MSGFYDINVPYETPLQTRKEILEQLIKAAYDGLAWNITASGKWHQNPNALVIKEIPLPSKAPISAPAASLSSQIQLSGRKTFKQYTRLTIRVDDPNQLNSIVNKHKSNTTTV